MNVPQECIAMDASYRASFTTTKERERERRERMRVDIKVGKGIHISLSIFGDTSRYINKSR